MADWCRWPQELTQQANTPENFEGLANGKPFAVVNELESTVKRTTLWPQEGFHRCVSWISKTFIFASARLHTK